MSKFLKIILLLLALAVALPFFIKDREGRPLLRLAYFKPKAPLVPEVPDVQGLLQTAGKMLPKPEAAEKPAKAYRWRDAEGRVHFSDRPNPHGPSEEVTVNPAANLMPARASAAAGRPAQAAAQPALAARSFTSVPLGQVPQMLDDANAVKVVAGQQEKDRQALLAQ